MTARPTRAEKREARRIKKNEDQKQKTVKLLASIDLGTLKKLKIAPIQDLGHKAVKAALEPAQLKTVYVPNQDVLTQDCNLTWCTTHSDVKGEWTWHEARAWTAEEWESAISPSFKQLERSTWHELQFEHKVPARGGKHVARNHFQEVSTLIEEAQQRWLEIGLEEYDTAFRFRFGGTLRAWGVKLSGHFYLVWWERYHKLYPVDP